jgi:predicted metal-binding protein
MHACMPLTDIAIRSAKPKEKSHKLAEFASLYLQQAVGQLPWSRNFVLLDRGAAA